MDEYLILKEIVLPISFVIGGIILGKIFETIILGKLKKITAKTVWEGDEIIIQALQGKVFLWCVLAGIYGAFFNLPLSPNILSFLEKTLRVFVLFSITVVLAKIAVGFVNLYGKDVAETLHSVSLLTNLTKIFVFILGALVIIQSLGISITPILTAMGVGGLAVALALQGTLSNLFSGIQIILSRQVKPGDFVKLSTGENGYVVDITWRNTTIRELPNNMIIVPNSQMASAIIINYNQPDKEMAVLVNMGVHYNSDLKKVAQIISAVGKEIMQEITGGVPQFEPFIRYHTFGNSSIDFTVILRAKEFVDQYLVKHEFIIRAHERFRQEGIVIPYPIRAINYEQEKGGNAAI